MELYISDHPLDCLTCPANGDCELQDMAGVVGLREVRYGYEGANHLKDKKDESNPYFTFDAVEVHRLLTLRARVRGNAGYVRADDRRARLRIARRRERKRAVHGIGMRVVRRVRRRRARPRRCRKRPSISSASPSTRRDDLRVLRRRLLVQGGDEGRATVVRMVPNKDGQREPRPLVREGPLRVGLRDAPGPHH